ncbi:PucR family transcriptional regulator [Streptomyces sp. enrichment culture]|uniref:PucR family transcriptional regulator n=1 Tax=Streptomyces sp. enrichment culture TaxID=1795815 RepID=UPI003F544C12
MTAMLLGQLVEALQDDVVSVLSVGAEAEPRIAGVELLDSHEVVRATASGHLLLAVGVDIADFDALDAALRTAADTSCALAVKCALPVQDDLLPRIHTTGVPVLAVNPQMPWTRVQRLVTTILAARAADSDASGSPTGGDLFSLANAVAGVVGGAVAIMDTQQVIVAYSNLPDQPIDETRRRGILGRRVPEDAIADHLDRKVWTSDTVTRHKRPGSLPRLAVVIRAGEDVLGSLWAAFPEDTPIPDCGPTLQEAARLAALHMLALRRQVDAEQESRDRALRTVLEGRTGQNDLPRGVGLPGVLVGMSEALQKGDETSDAGAAARRRAALLRLVDLAVLDSRSLGYEPAAALLGDRVYVLLPTAGSGPVSTGVLLDHLLGRARHSLHRSFIAVASPTVGALSPLLRARRDIDSALDHLCQQRADPGAYRTEELRPELVLRRLVDAVRGDPELRTGTVERLRAHDAEHATEYAATLLAYLRHFGDVVAASRELHIHQNTLRLRLRRAEPLFEVSLADPTRRLLLTLELAALMQS